MEEKLRALPASPQSAKIQNNFRRRLQMMSEKQSDAGGCEMKQALRDALEKFREKHRASGVQIAVDVDPISFM